MEIFENIQIPANTEYIIKFDTILADPANGIQRATDTGTNSTPAANLYKFTMLVKDNTNIATEIKISDFLSWPVETGAGLSDIILLSYQRGYSSAMYFKLILEHSTAIDDQVRIDFSVQDKLVNRSFEYTETLGMPLFPSGNKKHQLSAAEPVNIQSMSSVQLEGLAIRGDATNNIPAQQILMIKKVMGISSAIEFYTVDVTNPVEENAWITVPFFVTRQCRDDGLQCIYLRKSFKFKTCENIVEYTADTYQKIAVVNEFCCLKSRTMYYHTNFVCDLYFYDYWNNCKPKVVLQTTYSQYIERQDEDHQIPIYLEENYDHNTDFFIIHYPTHNWNEIHSILNGSCLEESFWCLTFPHQQTFLIKLAADHPRHVKFNITLTHLKNALYVNDINGTATATINIKQSKYSANQMTKIVGISTYYQPDVNPLFWDEFPDYGPFLTTSGTYDDVRLYMEPTQAIVRKYPLTAPFVLTPDYYTYDPIHDTLANYNTYMTNPKYYWLDDVWNTAKLQARFIWNRDYISYFQLQVVPYGDYYYMRFYDETTHSESFGQQYCNATIDIDDTSAIDPYVKSHPIQLKCVIQSDYFLYIYPSGLYPFPDYNYQTFTNAVITVYFKFVTQSFDIYNWASGAWYTSVISKFRLCGCYNQFTDSQTTCQYYQVSFAPWYQPYRKDLTFNRESFQDRIGVINEYTDLYFGIQPNTKQQDDSINKVQINRFVFHIPDAFTYPAVQTMYPWSVYGGISYSVSSFALNRTNGQTLVEIDSTTYNHSLTTARITSYAQTQRFKDPSIAGTSYQIGINLYQDKQLLDTGIANITIVGEFILSFVSKPSLDASTDNSLFQFTFTTGSYLTPEGYATPSNRRYSSIQIVFENMQIMNGYKNDLGTGLQTGDEIGCHCLSGLTLKNKNRYQCFLKLGTSPEDKPWIEMFNYEEIPAGTTITIMFTGLTTIVNTKWTYTYAGIRVYYKETYGIVQYYDLVNDISDVQVPPLTVSTYAGSAEVSGSKYVHEFANYTFKLTLTNTIKGSTSTDFLKIVFQDNMFNKQGDARIPSCSLGKLFVMGAANTIYLQPTLALSGVIILDLNNLENPQYSMSTQTVNIFMQEIVDDQLHDKFTFNVVREIISCESFSTFVVATNQSTGGLNNVTYEITVKAGHKIPNEGYLKINLPEEYGKLSVLGVTCKLENFGIQTQCSVNAYSIEVLFNGDAFNENQTYKIYLNGMNNPNVKMNLKQFNIFSMFSESDPTKIICSTKTNAPTILLTTLSDCSLLVQPNEATAKSITDYTFNFICQTDIRENSEIKLVLPDAYKALYQTEIKQTAAQQKIFQCRSNNSQFLRDDSCIMTISDNVIIAAKVNSESAKTSLNIIIKQLINPSTSGRITGFYVECESKQIKYGKSQQPALVIISSNDYQFISESKQIGARLQNIPISAGQPASYIFSLNVLGITPSYIFTSVNIKFSDYFSHGVSDDLKCGAFFSNSNNSLGYDDTLELFYSSNSKYISLPCGINERKVVITNVDNILKNKTTQYVNWVIQNVINPSSQIVHELTIEYASGTVNIYTLTDNFTITLSLTPSELYLSDKPFLTTYNIKNYAYYRFVIQLTENLISYEKLGILIKFPNSYKEVKQFQKRTNIYCDSSLNSVPGASLNCKFYGTNLLMIANNSQQILQNKQASNYSFNIIISEIMNPLIETTCSTSSTSLNSQFQFYDIQLINLKNGNLISRNYQANDKQNCVVFVKNLYSIRIVGEKKVYPGFSYLLTIILEQPYDGIIIIPTIYSKNHRITFNVSQISFDNFINDRQSILMIVDKATNPGSYSIQWVKQEKKHAQAFMEVLDTAITVMQINEQKQKPKIQIEQINVIGVNMLFDIAVTLEQPAAFKLCLNNKFVFKKSFNWLTKIIYTTPKKLCFAIGESKKYFSLFSKLELNSQILQFSLIPSEAAKIYNLTETQRTIYIEDQPNKDKTHIFNIKSLEITKNHAHLNVLVSEQSKIYYILAYRNSPVPSQTQLIKFNYNYQVQSGINHTILPTTMLEQASLEFNFTQLEANTKYSLFCIARGRHTYSEIYTFVFETKQLSNAAHLIFQLNCQTISDETIAKAFASTLCLHQDRFYILSKHNFDKPINSSIMNERPAIYEMLIIPNATDDYKTAIEYVQMLNDSFYYQKLKKALPQVKESFEITYREYVIDELKVAEEPKMILVTYYNATISMRFWKKAKVYAIRICENYGQNKNNKQKLLLSQQIYKGFDSENNRLNLTKYYTFQGLTDYYGKIEIFFDDLRPEKECTVYITAGSYVPFDPPKLMDDNEVRSITFQTPKNQNLVD